METMTEGVTLKVMTGPEMNQIPQPDGVQWPDDSLFVCAFEGEKLVGRMGLIAIPHIEGTWVDGEHRGSTLAFRLLEEMEKQVAELGRSYVFAFINEKAHDLEEYMVRCGYSRLPFVVYGKEL